MSVDPKWKTFPSQTPYNYALNNPILLIDSEGELPILPWLIKYAAQFGVGVGVDITLQMTAAYLFSDAKNINEAWAQVNLWQAVRSGGENLIGNKHASALISAFGDVTSYYFNDENPTTEGALKTFILGGASAYIGDWVSKYGANKVTRGLQKLKIDPRIIYNLTGNVPRVGKYGKNVKEINFDNLNPLHDVPRKGVDPENIKKIRDAIEVNGYDVNSPVSATELPNGDLIVTGGHHRIAAMKLLGQNSAPTKIYSHKTTDPERLAYFLGIARITGKYKGYIPELSQDQKDRVNERLSEWIKFNDDQVKNEFKF